MMYLFMLESSGLFLQGFLIHTAGPRPHNPPLEIIMYLFLLSHNANVAAYFKVKGNRIYFAAIYPSSALRALPISVRAQV